MSAHTPAPWTATVRSDGGRLCVTGADESTVVGGCGCCDSPYTDQDHAEGNARLIAAAPEMKVALDGAPIISMYHGARGFEADRFIADYETWMEMRRTAIQKAEAQS